MSHDKVTEYHPSCGRARRRALFVGLAAAAIIPVLHVCYGFDFLRGALALPPRARVRPLDLSSTPLSRRGCAIVQVARET